MTGSYPQKFPQNKKGTCRIEPRTQEKETDEMNTVRIIKGIITISDIVMFICMAYFAQGLRWREEKDRASIIGFTWMMVTIVLSGCFLWI